MTEELKIALFIVGLGSVLLFVIGVVGYGRTLPWQSQSDDPDIKRPKNILKRIAFWFIYG